MKIASNTSKPGKKGMTERERRKKRSSRTKHEVRGTLVTVEKKKGIHCARGSRRMNGSIIGTTNGPAHAARGHGPFLYTNKYVNDMDIIMPSAHLSGPRLSATALPLWGAFVESQPHLGLVVPAPYRAVCVFLAVRLGARCQKKGKAAQSGLKNGGSLTAKG